MKLLFFILLLPCITNAQIVSDSVLMNLLIQHPPTDSGFNLGYTTPNPPYAVLDNCKSYCIRQAPKYDTIGPMLRLVSDTAHDHWNGVSAMWVYEVKTQYEKWVEKGTPVNSEGASSTLSLGGWIKAAMHVKWLDSKKKPLTLKVWEDVGIIDYSADGGNTALFDIYDHARQLEIKNNTIKQ